MNINFQYNQLKIEKTKDNRVLIHITVPDGSEAGISFGKDTILLILAELKEIVKELNN